MFGQTSPSGVFLFADVTHKKATILIRAIAMNLREIIFYPEISFLIYILGTSCIRDAVETQRLQKSFKENGEVENQIT